ncbi:hypothetical protein NDU88_001099 [Pleurodeles waltl]|uniref:Uncharacterized protein n=1 Tax=Pleurodeles waltl TaxID=8319 RepID=A0AAV7NA00_PLEWA|nr:hypothetical protein NDU88_001099 [Pleurodeles waltl]
MSRPPGLRPHQGHQPSTIDLVLLLTPLASAPEITLACRFCHYTAALVHHAAQGPQSQLNRPPGPTVQPLSSLGSPRPGPAEMSQSPPGPYSSSLSGLLAGPHLPRARLYWGAVTPSALLWLAVGPGLPTGRARGPLRLRVHHGPYSSSLSGLLAGPHLPRARLFSGAVTPSALLWLAVGPGLPTRKSLGPSAPPRPPGPLLQLSVGPPGRTSPPQGKALLGRHHTVGAPLAGCRARAPNTEEPAALCASASQAPIRHLRVLSLARWSLRYAGVRLPRSR